MKKTLAALMSAALFLTASGCVTSTPPAPTPEPTPSVSEAAAEIEAQMCMYGDCDVHAFDLDGNGQYEVSLRYSGAFEDSVVANYIEALSSLLGGSGIPYESVAMSMHQDGTKYKKMVDWESGDGAAGRLSYKAYSVGADGKPDLSTLTSWSEDDFTFEDVAAALGDAGLDFGME